MLRLRHDLQQHPIQHLHIIGLNEPVLPIDPVRRLDRCRFTLRQLQRHLFHSATSSNPAAFASFRNPRSAFRVSLRARRATACFPRFGQLAGFGAVIGELLMVAVCKEVAVCKDIMARSPPRLCAP
jgi:hypothetical protein